MLHIFSSSNCNQINLFVPGRLFLYKITICCPNHKYICPMCNSISSKRLSIQSLSKQHVEDFILIYFSVYSLNAIVPINIISVFVSLSLFIRFWYLGPTSQGNNKDNTSTVRHP